MNVYLRFYNDIDIYNPEFISNINKFEYIKITHTAFSNKVFNFLLFLNLQNDDYYNVYEDNYNLFNIILSCSTGAIGFSILLTIDLIGIKFKSLFLLTV